MKAALYARVSTEDQEREGTSLQSQEKACLKKASELGYEAPDGYLLKEVYSGLTLDRPRLTQLRQWVRNKEIDAVVLYSTDRLSRDPVHLLLLVEELDKAKVALIFVTEPMDNSMEGQLLSFVRGWASKLEAIKIKERTVRGRRERALSGKLPAGSHARLYGYTYIRGNGIGEGIRYVNEEEAKWVREMYRWLIEERLSTDAITYRLRDLSVPTPSGKGYWIRSTVLKILRNPAYCGKTYAFTCTYGEPTHRLKPNVKRKNTGIIWRPKEEWIEIPGATPSIISEDIFNAAQERLEENRKMATRNSKNEYLLHGHIYCARCGRAFWGAPGIKPRNGKQYRYPFYHCSGKSKKVTPVRCDNRQHNAERLERLVWTEIEKVLSQPEMVFQELERRRVEQKTNPWERDLERITIQLENRQKQKRRVWKAFEITGDEETFRKDITLLQEEVQALEKEKVELKNRIEGNEQFEFDIDNLKKACELVVSNLKGLGFEEKRLTLQALQIRVLVDGDCITIQGAVPLQVGQVVNAESGLNLPARHRE
ncbi:recombinase family protein [Dehalococcoidia bacterium]|nr:recombinase family protein [Dehalococcoidia bacterium]